jgi:hypothetical protein
MVSAWKYTIFLALALPAIYAYAPPNLGDIAQPRWLDSLGAAITRSLTSIGPEPSESPIDPIAAANVDEDVDYRIAQRTKSTEGWRTFLTAHPDGPHAQFARAELDKLVPSVTPPAPGSAQAMETPSPEPKTPVETGLPDPSPAASGATAPASDETCREDKDRLERLSSSLTGDGVVRLLIELRCEKLRPQLLRLAERLDDKTPTPAVDADHGAPSSILPGTVVSAPSLPPTRMRANEPQKRTHSPLSSRGVQPKRHANVWAAPNLPQLLLALFGQGPGKSTGVRRTRTGGGGGQ